MSGNIDIESRSDPEETQTEAGERLKREMEATVPSNPVYARVGDTVFRAAQSGVRRGLRPEDIIREIVEEHQTRLTLGELRLLLASRRLPV
jgi:hypothetical protein